MCHTSPHPPGLSTAGPVSLSQLMQQHQQHQQGRGASNQPLLPTTTSYNIPPPPPGFASSSSTSLSDLVKRHRDPGGGFIAHPNRIANIKRGRRKKVT